MRDDSDLHDAYGRLIERAAASGVLPTSGLTPREQRDRLIDAGHHDPGSLQQLTSLLERCVYERCGTEAEHQQGIALCGALTDQIPPPPVTPRPSAVRRLIRHLLMAISGHPGPVLVAVGLILLVLVIWRAGVPGGAPGVTRSGWRGALAPEVAAVGAQPAASTWARPAMNRTWSSVSIDEVLRPEPLSSPARPQLDMQTGIDGNIVGDDPFTPPLQWRHRLHVYDTVDSDYRCGRSVTIMRPLDARPEGPLATYDVSVQVDLIGGVPVAVPSPTPKAIVTSHRSSRPVNVRFVKDGNDALHVVSRHTELVRLNYRVVAPDDYETAPLPDVPFSPVPIDLPMNVCADAQQVIDAIGELPQPTYRQTVRRLHRYFAGFAVSPIEPHEQHANQYLTIALARKGVCRHRARTFFVTASALGVRTRLVENRKHSFCEVELPGGAWRRMEFRLGDEEGTPGVGEPRAINFDSIGGTIALVPLLVLVALFAAACRQTERSAHRLEPSPPRPTERAPRDLASQAERACFDGLIDAVDDTVGARLSVPIAVPRRAHPPTEPCGDQPSLDPSMPAALGARLRRVQAMRGEPIETGRVPGLFWDCFYLLRWSRRDRS